jgi:protein-tyrosine phosphatase
MAEVCWVAVGPGRIALSQRPKLKDIPKLAEQGCHRIVTIQGHNEQPGQIERAAQQAGLAWTWVAVCHGKFPQDEADRLLRRGLQELVCAVEAGQSVLVHYSAGIHRTGMLVFALLRWLGLSESDALEKLGAMRSATREGIRQEQLAWGNQVASEAGRA